MQRQNRTWAALVLAVACLGLLACGEDDGGGNNVKPSIGQPTIVCGPWLGDEFTDYDGDFLQRIEVTVSDASGDLAGVTATWRGTVFDLTSDGEGLYSVDTADTDGALLRCDPPAPLLIRAQDAAGNVSELLVEEM
jgi:hypothetical protein